MREPASLPLPYANPGALIRAAPLAGVRVTASLPPLLILNQFGTRNLNAAYAMD